MENPYFSPAHLHIRPVCAAGDPAEEPARASVRPQRCPRRLLGARAFLRAIAPQNGITYFISGGAGSLRIGDLRRSGLTAQGYDRDHHFMLIEISGDELYYQAISRTGETIDSGMIRRQEGDK